MATVLHQLVGSSPTALAESALLAVAFAWIGYRMSVRHRAARGVTPWKLPPAIWALICLVFQFLGVALELLAELTTRPALRTERGAPGGAPLPSPNAYPPPVGTPVGAVGSVLPPPVAPDQPLLMPPRDGSGRNALFGWYPDPLGRHRRRYFDGRRWSDLVADGEQLVSDPLPMGTAAAEASYATGVAGDPAQEPGGGPA